MILAQNPAHIQTIEGRINGATTVYVATMTSANPEGQSFQLEIKETLRGPKLTHLTIAQTQAAHWSTYGYYQTLIQNKTTLLIDNAYGKWSWLEMDGENADLFLTADLREGRLPINLLPAARAFVKAHPKELPVVRLQLPYRIAAKAGCYSTWNALQIPLTKETEATGRRFLRANSIAQSSAPAGAPSREEEAAHVRVVGIQILAHFRSAENERLIRSHLQDPFVGPIQNFNDRYPVRVAAELALSKWQG